MIVPLFHYEVISHHESSVLCIRCCSSPLCLQYFVYSFPDRLSLSWHSVHLCLNFLQWEFCFVSFFCKPSGPRGMVLPFTLNQWFYPFTLNQYPNHGRCKSKQTNNLARLPLVFSGLSVGAVCPASCVTTQRDSHRRVLKGTGGSAWVRACIRTAQLSICLKQI